MFLKCVWVFSLCVCFSCTPGVCGGQESVGASGIVVRDHVSCHVGAWWELNPSPLQEQPVLYPQAISPVQKSLCNWNHHHGF